MIAKSYFKTLLLILSFLLTGNIVFSQSWVVNYTNLPNDPLLDLVFDELSEIGPYSDHYVPEWNYPIEKKEIESRLLSLIDSMNIIIDDQESPNEDLFLLKGSILTYLYNVDHMPAHEELRKLMEEVIELFPHSYRPKWMLANHLFESGFMLEANAVFSEFLDLDRLDEVNPYALVDYGAILQGVLMPAHSFHFFDQAASKFPELSEISWFVKTRHERYLESSVEELSINDVVTSSRHDSHINFLLRPLGASFNVPLDWEMRNLHYENGTFISMLKPPAVYTESGMSVTFTILFLANNFAGSIEEHVDRFTRNDQEYPEIEDFPLDFEAEVYQVLDPDLYPPLHGLDGRLILFQREEPSYPGIIFEHPVDIKPTSNDGEPQYMAFQPIQARIPGKLSYVVMLDVGADALDPALEYFQYFLDNLIIE